MPEVQARFWVFLMLASLGHSAEVIQGLVRAETA